ncbi:retrovirus-related Pol polyprotein from transposon 412 [Trichonephila clavipes]|nr:retrovirus-related Pol polyprotein from transposon 412 [Trichonephila clavipes]
MKELSNGQLQDDFLQSLWLQRMPPHIQTVLSASSEPLDKLAIIADKVSEVVCASSTICAATTVPPPSQSSSCSVQPTMDSLARQIQELSLQVAELTRERNSSRHQRYSSDRRRSHSRSRSVNRGSGICYYHRCYKEQARKCVSPCAFVQKKTNSGSEICVIPPSPTMNKSPLSSFQEPSQRFDHVHLDLIGPLPPSNGHTYCMTMIDRFSKWPEAQPLKDITAETVAEAFFSSWVSRFGTPAILTTDRGRQFESSHFKALSKLLGVQKCRTTGYHPQANGMIEELHRPLKIAIKCHATERWTEVLPIILLGLRASLKEDILCIPAELVFGTTIRLPGEMFDSSKPDDDVVNFVSKLKSHMQSLHPKPPKHHSKRPVFIHPGLLVSTHVFLRRDMLRHPLQQPYDGPFKVLQRKDKVFFLDINGKRVSVSIDRCKPAFFLNTEDLQLPQTKNETPATVEPNATASTPATVESDPTASTPTQPSTRSGRKVHLPTRYL